MEALCAFANAGSRGDRAGPEAFIHPVVRAIIVHFWLLYDRPFAAG